MKANDPLLSVTKIILATAVAILVTATVLVGIGVCAIFTVQRGELLEKIAAADLASSTYWIVVAGVIAIGVMLFLATRFALEFYRTVSSVEDGNPFAIENAERLARMGWLALAIQLIAIPVGIASVSLGKLSVLTAEFEISGGGILLVLTLFVLARVFRHGAEMREDLQGTV